MYVYIYYTYMYTYTYTYMYVCIVKKKRNPNCLTHPCARSTVSVRPGRRAPFLFGWAPRGPRELPVMHSLTCAKGQQVQMWYSRPRVTSGPGAPHGMFRLPDGPCLGSGDPPVHFVPYLYPGGTHQLAPASPRSSGGSICSKKHDLRNPALGTQWPRPRACRASMRRRTPPPANWRSPESVQ